MSTLSIINARIIDPASGFDDFGTVLIEDGLITAFGAGIDSACLLYTSPSPRDQRGSRMPSSA